MVKVTFNRSFLTALGAMAMFWIVLLACVMAKCQSMPVLPNAPSAPSVRRPVHRFWDARNVMLFGAGATLIAVDGWQTQTCRPNCREDNPIARPFTRRGWPGQVAASGLGIGSTIGIAYLFHRTGHHKLERIASMVVVGVELETIIHNKRRGGKQ